MLTMLLFGGAAIWAQPVMKISSAEHDFGKFKEEAGSQKYDFVVMNTGNQPLVIQNIVASCGCTTPEWTKGPIPPKGTGKITAIYDPRDRPGHFNKTLSVYTNSKPEIVVLVIKGEVIPHEKTVEELFHKGMILKPHPQYRSGKEPKYDLIIISEEGKAFVENL